jgi:hypothetical protein
MEVLMSRRGNRPFSPILAFGLFCAILGVAGSSPVPEYELKAKFLPHFAAAVTWPPDVIPSFEKAIRVGVLGEDPFGDALEKAFQREKQGAGLRHPVEIVRSVKLADIQKCHMVFVSRSEQNRMDEILAVLGTRSVLTVGEGERFVQQGGIIGFRMRGNQVRFAINPDAALRVGLLIDSDLLDLAEIVRDPERKKAH